MLKKLSMLLLLFWGQQHGFAQFSQARLQATGLTCAMCSKAIHQALEKLPFVQKVTAQLKESAFDITVKPGQHIEPALIRMAVEEAGFFIGALYLIRGEESVMPALNSPFKEGGSYYIVVEKAARGEGRTCQILNEHFLTEKAFAKIQAGPQGTVMRQQPGSIEGSIVFYLKCQ